MMQKENSNRYEVYLLHFLGEKYLMSLIMVISSFMMKSYTLIVTTLGLL